VPEPPKSPIGTVAPPGTQRGAAAAKRRVQRLIRIALLLIATLAVAGIAWSTWDALRWRQRERITAAQHAAELTARDLMLAVQRQSARVHAWLDAQRGTIDETLGAPPRAAALPALEDALRAGLPELIDLRLLPPGSTPSSDEANAARLKAVDGEPLLQLDLDLDDQPAQGHRLRAVLRCDEACRPATKELDGLLPYLVIGGQRWALFAPETDAHLPTPAAAALASAAGASASPQDWQVEVYDDPGKTALSVVPRVLGGLSLAAIIIAGAIGANRWIRRQAELTEKARRDLRVWRQKLEAVLDASTDGILLATDSGVIQLFNPAAEFMFGQPPEDVLGKRLSDLLPDLQNDEMARADAAGRDTPVMVELEALRGDGQRFPARIWVRRLRLDDGKHALLVIQDLTESAHQAQQLEFLEQRDVITGLLNRKEFERRMQRLLVKAAGSQTPHVLCYIDIDQFKLINDTAGHAAGDALIAQLGTLFRARLDEAALLARLGGDEFGVLFADCTEEHALAICDDLMQTVRNFLFAWRDRSFDVAVSIGLTAFMPENDSAAAELAKADVACHMAKRNGRDRVHVYRDGDAAVARHHGEMRLVSTISKALSSGRFRLYAQPIMPLTPGAAGRTHYEILVRMLDEYGDPMAPEQFIPAAERYILMPAVDRWIVHQLFSTQGEQLRLWHDEHPDQFLFAINLSATSINDESFLPYLLRQFEVHRIPPAGICFEITETAALRSFGDARGFMRRLAEMGCTFALDDFGSGLSSYSYLRELPVKYLKIDGSFVHDMNSNPVNHALVASINQIAHVLALKTIAEWAEDDSTINQLRALNVDFVQGYAIGTPLPVVDYPFDLAAPPVEESSGRG